MNDLAAIVRNEFLTKKIVIVGDLVADQFLRGTISRVSREAPVFILRHNETETLAGGAANAAVNVAALGANAVLVGIVGDDQNGIALLESLRSSNVDCAHLVTSGKFQTTTKVRVLAGQHYAPRQQVIRIDYENSGSIDPEVRRRIVENLLAACDGADAIILSDYNYGVANEQIATAVWQVSNERNIPLLIDSRFHLRNFPNATTATPNQDEVEQLLGKDFTESDCRGLCAELGYQALLVTRGNQGMLLLENDKPTVRFEAIGSKEPVDVTGAGDTVIAAYALGLASGLSFSEAARLANHAGGIVVMKKRTAVALADEVIASLTNDLNAGKSAS